MENNAKERVAFESLTKEQTIERQEHIIEDKKN